MATSTTNLGLTKPAGTDKIRIAQINGNMDILDEKIGAVGNTSLQAQITSQNEAIANLAEYESIGSVASRSDLETALDTKLATMTAGTNVSISVVISSVFGAFAKTTYYAKLSRVSTNFATALFEECNITDNKLLIKATKSAGTWYFEGVALKSEIMNVQNGLAYIVGNTNTTGSTLAVGQFVYVKGHSTITEGLYKVTSSISANGSITTSNTSACSNGGLNALNDQIANINVWSNTPQKIGKYGNKDVYRQVFEFGSYSDGVAKDLANNFDHTILSINGSLVQNDGSMVAINHFSSTTSYSNCYKTSSGNTFRFIAKPAGSSGIVVVEYFD